MTTLVIRGGTIIDGTGGDPYEADLAISDGKISAIGGAIPKGARTRPPAHPSGKTPILSGGTRDRRGKCC